MKRGTITALFALAGLIFGLTLFGLSFFTPTPTPQRHYDPETGVMCYTVPGAISCVEAGE